MRITKRQLRRVIREQREAIPGGNVIGIISANIGGDSRYNQKLTVTHNPSTDETTILVQDVGAVGGMDYQGPGEGRGKYSTTGKQILPAGTNGKGLVVAIKHMIKRRADTIKMYGKPTKNFMWGDSVWSRGPKGLNAALANAALQQSRDLKENMKITKRQIRRIIREEKKRYLTESSADMQVMQEQIDGSIDDITGVWAAGMDGMFDEDPESFAGRTTQEEWTQQVDAAHDALATAIKSLVEREIERVEMELHDGQYHPTSGGPL